MGNIELSLLEAGLILQQIDIGVVNQISWTDETLACLSRLKLCFGPSFYTEFHIEQIAEWQAFSLLLQQPTYMQRIINPTFNPIGVSSCRFDFKVSELFHIDSSWFDYNYPPHLHHISTFQELVDCVLDSNLKQKPYICGPLSDDEIEGYLNVLMTGKLKYSFSLMSFFLAIQFNSMFPF